jgi:hypothetical protein
MAGGGLRFHWTHAGFDLTLVHLLGSSQATLPIFAFTYRT